MNLLSPFSICGLTVYNTDAYPETDFLFKIMEPTMISQDKADACLGEVSTGLKAMSYEELEEFAIAHCTFGDWQNRQLQIDGETIYVNTLMYKLGRIHKRISVEIVLSAENDNVIPNTTALYFERYKSGRFYPSPKEEAREVALIKSLPFVFYGGIVIGLLVLVWYFFLRSG